jgi:selenium metabolism protein YedF
MKSVDCRGLNCPEPVIKTKQAMAEMPGADLKIIVDNEIARDNVSRFARNQGRSADWTEENGLFSISITGSDDNIISSAGTRTKNNQQENPVILISTSLLGQGSDELGAMLMRNFIYTLTKRDDLPGAIVFMNSGVKLTIANSPALDELLELEGKGVQLLVCGTCLDYYQLKEVHKAGQVSNMYDISDLLLAADRVVTL